jgi:hypothetical protein
MTDPSGRHPGPIDSAGFSQRVSLLTVAQLLLLRSVWNEQDVAARLKAWDQVRGLAESTGRSDELRDLETGLAQWSTASREPVGGLLGFGMVGPLAEIEDVRRAGLPPVMDAGAALLFATELTPDAFDALIGPWRAMEAGEEGEAPFEPPG